MKLLVVAGLLVVSAAASFAQEMTTIQYMVKNGVVIRVTSRQGRPIEMHVTYKDDGTSTMTGLGDQELPGKWRADGDKFCTSNAMNPTETCFDVPPGKKPGDEIKVTTALGEGILTINK